MRTLLPLCLIALLPTLGLSADEPKAKKVDPIRVVKVERKDPLVYEKDIEPILYKKCQFCHAGPVKEGRFDLGTYEALMRGGRSGKAIVPEKSAESLLVKSAGRTEKPYMPPLKSDQEPLSPEELALIKLWIDQGAKPPTSGARERPKVVLTLLPATVRPVRAIALSPDKTTVAAGRGNQLHLFNAQSGDLVRSLLDPGLTTADKKPVEAAHMSIVTSLAYSPDGKTLASGS